MIVNCAHDSHRITEKVIGSKVHLTRVIARSNATKQSDPKGHSEHIHFVQCKLREKSHRDCVVCPELCRGSGASQRHFVSDCHAPVGRSQ
jgi:hypothetical protein